MKRFAIKVSLAAAIATVSASAFAAYQDTDYFTIGRLEGSSAASDSFRVYPQNYALPTSQGCAKSDFAEIQKTGPLMGEKALMTKTLLAAFTASRKVKLRLDGCGANGRPAYRIVTIDADQ